MINPIKYEEVLSKIKKSYKLDRNVSNEVLIYNIIRRLAVVHTPCSINLLKSKLAEQINVLFDDLEITYDLEEFIQDIISYGDLLELSDVLIENGNMYTKNTLFLSQNKFIQFSDKEFYLIGISNEESLFLNDDINRKIRHVGPAKILTIENNEDLEKLTAEQFNFSELPKDVWISLPKNKIEDYYNEAISELNKSQAEVNLEDLEIFSHFYSNNYRKRQKPLENETGIFVSRKIQRFASDLWALIKTENGKILNFIDLPFQKNIKNNVRACDEAWRLSCAIDLQNGYPQKYKIHEDELNKKWIQFYSPVPKWVERQLKIQGGEKRKSFNKSLYSISTSETNLQNDKLFLRSFLGMEEFDSGND